MKVFGLSDLHLSFGTQNKSMDIFGPHWCDHWRKIEENWHKLIGADDIVLVNGDISWGLRPAEAHEDLNWVSNLPGTIVISKGNHDLWWSGISKVKTACKDMKSLRFLQHDAFAWGGAVVFGSRGWVCPGAKDYSEEEDGPIYRREVLRLQMSADEAEKLSQAYEAETGRTPEKIGVMHYPPRNEKFEPSAFSGIFEQTGVQKIVYGHLHGQNAFKNGPQGDFNGIEYHLVSLDRLECCPKLIYQE